MGCVSRSEQRISLEEWASGGLLLEMRKCLKFTIIFTYWTLATELPYTLNLPLFEGMVLLSTYPVAIYGLTSVDDLVFCVTFEKLKGYPLTSDYSVELCWIPFYVPEIMIFSNNIHRVCEILLSK